MSWTRNSFVSLARAQFTLQPTHSPISLALKKEVEQTHVC